MVIPRQANVENPTNREAPHAKARAHKRLIEYTYEKGRSHKSNKKPSVQPTHLTKDTTVPPVSTHSRATL